MKKIISLIILIFAVQSCGEKIPITKSQGMVFDYFPLVNFKDYNKENEVGSELYKYSIDGAYEAMISWERKRLIDNLTFKITSDYTKEENRSVGINIWEHNENQIITQKFDYDHGSSLKVFEGVYKYAIENNLDFKLRSGQLFRNGDKNFMTYEARVVLEDGEIRNTLGMICNVQDSTFLDFTMNSTAGEISELDYLLYTEMINSIAQKDKYLLPILSDSVQIVEVEL